MTRLKTLKKKADRLEKSVEENTEAVQSGVAKKSLVAKVKKDAAEGKKIQRKIEAFIFRPFKHH